MVVWDTSWHSLFGSKTVFFIERHYERAGWAFDENASLCILWERNIVYSVEHSSKVDQTAHFKNKQQRYIALGQFFFPRFQNSRLTCCRFRYIPTLCFLSSLHDLCVYERYNSELSDWIPTHTHTHTHTHPPPPWSLWKLVFKSLNTGWHLYVRVDSTPTSGKMLRAPDPTSYHGSRTVTGLIWHTYWRTGQQEEWTWRDDTCLLLSNGLVKFPNCGYSAAFWSWSCLDVHRCRSEKPWDMDVTVIPLSGSWFALNKKTPTLIKRPSYLSQRHCKICKKNLSGYCVNVTAKDI